MMKKSKKAISFRYPTCVFLILIPLLGTSYGDVNNILVNPGFESSTTGNWAARGCTFARTTSQKHTGSYSGLASARTQTWQGIQQNVLGKMVQDQTYVVSGWVRTNSVVSPSVHLTFEKTDGSGTTYAWAASGTAGSTWTYISGSYTLTVNGTLTGLNVYVESSDLNNIYLDDANVFGQVPGAASPDANGQINFAVTHQTLEGFGASGAWYQNNVITYGNSHPEIYNILFRDLGIDIYRIRNTYNIDSSYITQTAQIIAAGEATLGHPLRIMNTSWSPPANLKSNNNTSQGTLLANPPGSGNYMYTEFAQWWADSLAAWSAAGVDSYYVNMQNEPGYQDPRWDTCQFNPTQDSSYAGYEQAFAALCANLNSLPNRPILLAPEGQDTTSTPSYVSALTAADKSNVYGYSHHLYNGDPNNPDGLIAPMTTLKAAIGGDNKPLLQTEYSRGGLPDQWANAMNLAKLMHNALTVEEVSAYLYWELFWPSPGGLVSVSTTSYTINPIYYIMKHYSKFTDPNWQRVDANSTSSDLRITAYKDPCEPNAAIVVINTSTTTDMNLTLSLNGFNPGNSGIYQSTSNTSFAYIGTFSTSLKVPLPKQSITTIHLAGFGDCNSVQAGYYRLDSDLNGDCYVNLLDLEIMADYWLHTNCAAPGNCQNADFAPTDGTVDFLDFADFGPQWRQCNNPQDANCTPNWPL